MPQQGDYGHGEYTPLKVQHFGQIARAHLSIVKQILGKRDWAHPRYCFLDITAGPGLHPATAESQAPLVFVGAVREIQVPCQAVFIERDKDTHATLSAVIGPSPGIRCIHGDHHHELLPAVANMMPQDRPIYFGMVYYDVTPCAEMFGSLRFLAELSARRQFQCMDFLVYLSAARVKGLHKFYESIGENGTDNLIAILKSFRKEHWFIREPAGGHQWTFLIGTNWGGFPADVLRKNEPMRLFKIGTPDGDHILARLAWTKAEREFFRRQQPGLFDADDDAACRAARKPPYRTYREYLKHPRFLAVKAEVFRRAKGICERCGQRRATDPHHLRYPPWGTFDVPENLIAVCHPCHCELHGKES